MWDVWLGSRASRRGGARDDWHCSSRPAGEAVRGTAGASRGQAGEAALRTAGAAHKLPRETGVLPPAFREKSRSYRTRFLGDVGSWMDAGDGWKVTLWLYRAKSLNRSIVAEALSVVAWRRWLISNLFTFERVSMWADGPLHIRRPNSLVSS
jgi:hypothetical protein